MENDKISKIMEQMDTISYGFPDEFGRNILTENEEKWEKEFPTFYYLQTPEELMKTKYGVCLDQVELERQLFQELQMETKTFFIYIVDEEAIPSHTFLTYKSENKYYWFEHSWGIYRGIHEYNSERELLLDVKEKFKENHKEVTENSYLYIYEYQKPEAHLSYDAFCKYIETQKLIKTNEPFYFYHLVNKNADMSKGLISLQYMYDQKMYDVFDKNVLKYKDRITNDWNIPKYKGKEELSRDEYLDALNTFRGEFGSNYIYFFKYAPYKGLGKKIEEIAKYKDIYRINLNDEELQKKITDIFYGYDGSNSDNKMLDRKYYETISKEEYFSKYDDSLPMNFSTLNHIGISFEDGYCSSKFLEKIEWEETESKI